MASQRRMLSVLLAGACGISAIDAAPPSVPTIPAARAAAPVESASVLQKALRGPLAGCEEIVFAVRVSGRDHWYVNFGHYVDDPNKKGFRSGGKLCRLNLRTGKLNVLLDDPIGGVRDPIVHYDAKRILFSYRKGKSDYFHLYEINTDGTGLLQLTDGPYDDIEPIYLPDGGILFCSSRCNRYVPCWCTPVANLHRCDGDGANLRMVSSNIEQDNTPWLLPDGRVLYMRWEYVDRSQVSFHHLWTVNPDGTGQMVYFGNQQNGVTMLDAKPIPGTNQVVASFSPGHGLPEHMGHVTIVDTAAGPDVASAHRRVTRGSKLFRDPYPVTASCFLVADEKGIWVLDGTGAAELVYSLPAADAGLECHEPRPLAPRPREQTILDRTDPTQATGRLVLANIYEGRNMTGVRRGEIKKLLVLEQLPKPVNFNGAQPYHISWMEPLSISGTFTLSRIVGTVPVEPDGSAYVELPALRSLQFVALDANDLSVKRMQSFVTVQPGETTGCVGCHEQRSRTGSFGSLAALRRPPSPVTPISDVPDVIDFPRDVQPILDHHCVGCHNADRRDGGVDFSADRTPVYSVAYWTMVKRRLFADGRNQPYGNRAPRTIGSSASRIWPFLEPGHYDVRVSARDKALIRLWIESGATYAGTYAALGCGMYPVEFPAESLVRRCGGCHDAKAAKEQPSWQGYDIRPWKNLPFTITADHPPLSLCNVSRPDKSLLLRAPLAKAAGGLGLCNRVVFAGANDPDYQKIRQAIAEASRQLSKFKRFDMPGFVPNEHYLREMQRMGILPETVGPDRPPDVYAADSAYWKSFWHRPVKKQAERVSLFDKGR